MAADKALSLNPQFTNNVGTIEVIILRCKTDADDSPPPKVLRSRTADNPARSNGPKRSAAVAPAASVKAASAEGNMLGGLFGLFDGACDDISLNLDGAADQPLIGPDGRVRPDPPPGMVFDPVAGQFVPEDALIPPTEVRMAMGMSDDMKDQIQAIEENLQQESAQLDGHGGYPGVVINQRGSRGRDEMPGDKYLGLQGQTRSEYKQWQRETGQSVSTDANYGQARNVQPRQAQSEGHPLRPDPANIARRLETMRIGFLNHLKEHPDHRRDAVQHKLAIISRLQHLQQQAGGDFSNFPMWLTEVLTDLEIRRQYVIRLGQTYPGMNFTDLKEELENAQTSILLDLRYWKEFNLTQIDDCVDIQAMFDERVVNLKKFIEKAERFSKTSTQDLRRRVEFVMLQRDRAREAVEYMKQLAHVEDPQRQARGWNINDPDHVHHGASGAGDGAYQHDWNYPNANQRNDHGFEQVGAGVWNPLQRHAEQPQWATNGEAFGGDQQGHGWPTGSCQGKRSNAAQANAWDNNDNPNGNRSESKKNEGNWKDTNNDRNNSISHKTYEHNFSNGDDHKDAWKGSQSQHTSRQSNKNDAWYDGQGNKSQVDDDWTKKGGSGKGGNDRWNGDSKELSRSESRSRSASRSRSIQTAVKAQEADPTAYIKPYWKDWNKPFSRNESTDPGPKKIHDEPREVYTYPASSLPAVPKKKVTDASHGIQTGRGADYTHKTHRPVYIDTMERPYAVFSFKYRSKEALEKILRTKVDTAELKDIQKQAEEARLNMLPKHKLIQELMEKRAPQKSASKRTATNHGSNSGSSRSRSQKDDKGSNGWNDQGGSNKQASNGWEGNNDNAAWGNGGGGSEKRSDRKDESKGSSHSSKKSDSKSLKEWAANKTTKNPMSFGSKDNKQAGGWAQTSGGNKNDATPFAGW